MLPAAHVRSVVGMLDEAIKKLATGKNFAAVTTLLPDGTPMTQPLWVDADDDHLLLNTEVHRQKFRNIQRDPRITVAIWDSADPYVYVEVRGEVAETVRGPEARAHIDELARKYTGGDYPGVVQSERVVLKVAPTRRQFIRGE
jgi:PPOX class probable F420-dependent enzyme